MLTPDQAVAAANLATLIASATRLSSSLMIENGVAVRILAAAMIREGARLACSHLTDAEVADGLRQLATEIEEGRYLVPADMVTMAPAGHS